MIVVLDNLAADTLVPQWDLAVAAAARGDFDAARVCLEPLRTAKMTESLFVHQLGTRALEVGRMDRIHVHGLTMPDVICYLPPDLVLLKPADWDELVHEWRRDALPHVPKDIKAWLKKKKKKLLSVEPDQVDQRIENAVTEARRSDRPVHADLVGLGVRIGELAADATVASESS